MPFYRVFNFKKFLAYLKTVLSVKIIRTGLKQAILIELGGKIFKSRLFYKLIKLF